MTHPLRVVPALAACVLLAPSAYSLTVEDTDVKLGLRINLQIRGEYGDAQDSTGNRTSIMQANSVDKDPVDFYVRRARVGFVGSWKGDYRFALMMNMDNMGKGAGWSGTGANALMAHVGRVIKADGLEHVIGAGLDYAFFNSANNWGGSGLLIPSRATDKAALLAPRGVGVSYRLTAPNLVWGANVQNNVADDNAGAGDGLCYTTRVHLSPEGDWKIPTYQESWAGKPGTGVLVGLEYGVNVGAETATTRTTTSAWGAEILLHVDGLSALAEWREATAENTATGAETKRRVYLVQAGYAFPAPAGTVIEPAIRYSVIDLDTSDDNETASYAAWAQTPASTVTAAAEHGGSGTQLECGVNWYLHGNGHKLQLAAQLWEAEEGDADATIVRAQWAMSF